MCGRQHLCLYVRGRGVGISVITMDDKMLVGNGDELIDCWTPSQQRALMRLDVQIRTMWRDPLLSNNNAIDLLSRMTCCARKRCMRGCAIQNEKVDDALSDKHST